MKFNQFHSLIILEFYLLKKFEWHLFAWYSVMIFKEFQFHFDYENFNLANLPFGQLPLCTP